MQISFDNGARQDKKCKDQVTSFLSNIPTQEQKNNSPVTIYQDGRNGSYYIKCSIVASEVVDSLDLNARLNPSSKSSYRANRELWLTNYTYQKMKSDAEKGREFHDIIVEFSTEYTPEKPLKVWGGQHRSKAIQEAYVSTGVSRYHGFRIYFCLTKEQRADLALISNTNISVSNDLFDRQIEETLIGTSLREWCVKVSLLNSKDDFPDQASKSEKISVKLARTFIVNYIKGKEKGEESKHNGTDIKKEFYAPYLCISGADIDPEYMKIIEREGGALWQDQPLLNAGLAFENLHKAQRSAVENSKKIEKRKAFKNKALTASVIAGWSYIAGLLQSYPVGLNNLYTIPKPTRECPDPLNAKGMSIYHHDNDERTYRGLGTRTIMKDRQRMAQVFLVKSESPDSVLNKGLLNRAVSQVVALSVWKQGYPD